MWEYPLESFSLQNIGKGAHIANYQSFVHFLCLRSTPNFTSQLRCRIKQYEHACSRKEFLKLSCTTEKAMCISGIWFDSWACEVIAILTQKILPHCIFV